MRFASAYTVGFLVLLVVGCGGGDGLPQGAGGDGDASEASGIAGLVQRLDAADDLQDRADVVRDIAVAAGITVLDHDGDVDREPEGPASGVVMAPFEAIQLADDVGVPPGAGRTTLEQYAQMLAGFGWPFHPDRPPGNQLRDALSDWAREAWRSPDEPRHFAPMFIAQMADRHDAGLNVTAGDYDPAALTLSTLEVYVLEAGLRRLVAPGDPLSLAPPVSPAGGMRLPGWLPISVASAQARDCEGTKDFFGEIAGGVVDSGAGEIAGYLLEKALRLTGQTVSAVVGAAMSALGSGFQAIKLAQFYYLGNLEVEPISDDVVEKPLASEADRIVGFVATAGMTEGQWDVVQEEREKDANWRELRACIGYFGLPMPPDWGSVVDGLDTWRVQWRLFGDHAEIVQSAGISEFNAPGVLAQRVERQNEHSGTALLLARLKPQRAKDRTGEPRTDYVHAKAMLDTTTVPIIGALGGAMQDGLSDSGEGGLQVSGALSSLFTDAVREFAKPTAYSTVEVRSYGAGEGGAWTGHIKWTQTHLDERSDEYMTGKRKTVSEYRLNEEAVAVVTLDGLPPIEPGVHPGQIDYQASKEILRDRTESEELRCAIPGTWRVFDGFEYETRPWKYDNTEEGFGSETYADDAQVRISIDESEGTYTIWISFPRAPTSNEWKDLDMEWTETVARDPYCPPTSGPREPDQGRYVTETETRAEWDLRAPEIRISGTFEPGEEPILVGRTEDETSNGRRTTLEWRLDRAE